MLRRPACGNTRQAHPAHRFPRWSSDIASHGSCDGWTQTDVDVTAMVEAVNAARVAHEIAHPVDVPALRLELHTTVHRALIRTLDPSTADFGELLGSPVPVYLCAELKTLLGIPIVLADLPPGRWRLIVPGPVLASGEIL